MQSLPAEDPLSVPGTGAVSLSSKENNMETIVLGSYILVWPAITLGMLGLISYAVVRDYREAKRTNVDMVSVRRSRSGGRAFGLPAGPDLQGRLRIVADTLGNLTGQI